MLKSLLFHAPHKVSRIWARVTHLSKDCVDSRVQIGPLRFFLGGEKGWVIKLAFHLRRTIFVCLLPLDSYEFP